MWQEIRHNRPLAPQGGALISHIATRRFPTILIAAICLLPSLLIAELVKGWADLRLAPEDEPVLILFGGVSIDSDFPSSDFVRVGMVVLLEHQDFIRDVLIRKGTPLRDTSGQAVGKTVADFEPLLTEDHGSGEVLAFIRGYIPKVSIDPSSVPEYELDTLVQNTVGVCDAKLLVPHINKFKYQSCLSYEGFTSYIMHDAEPISSPGIRVVLVFQANKLFAIIHPNTIISSLVFPFRKDALVIQYFTTDKALIKKFDEGFYFQFKSAG